LDKETKVLHNGILCASRFLP